MATETHPRRAYPACARGQGEEVVDGEVCVFVVGGQLFGDLVLVAGVGAGAVVGERFRARELVVAGWRGDDVAAAG
jgi:hypothetical protein